MNSKRTQLARYVIIKMPMTKISFKMLKITFLLNHFNLTSHFAAALDIENENTHFLLLLLVFAVFFFVFCLQYNFCLRFLMQLKCIK